MRCTWIDGGVPSVGGLDRTVASSPDGVSHIRLCGNCSFSSAPVCASYTLGFARSVNEGVA